MPSITTILVVATADPRRLVLTQQLEALGYSVIALGHSGQLAQMLKQSAYDLLILDASGAAADEAHTLSTIAADLLARGVPVLTFTADQQLAPQTWAQAALGLRVEAALRNASASDVLAERALRWEGLNVLDPITALFNRRYFDAVLPTEIERAKRIHQPTSLLLLDLGCVPADDLPAWRSTSLHLINSLRQTDLLARYSASAIAILLPATEAPLARVVAARLQKILTNLPLLDHRVPTIPIGIAAYPQHGASPAALLAAAQQAQGQGAVPHAVVA